MSWPLGKKHTKESRKKMGQKGKTHWNWRGGDLKALARNRAYKHKYKVTYDDVARIFEKQNGKCAICGKKLKLGGMGQGYAYVDHNHLTGKIRGLLCTNCNTGIGAFKELLDNLLSAVEYLRNSPGRMLGAEGVPEVV